ncbi:MAG: cysteine protease StiP domain-containing protein [Clostridium sp.]
MRSSYKDDCIFLLKEIDIKEITIEEKEKLISEGVSYSEMISKEKEPSKEIMDIFYEMVENDKKEIALYVSRIAEVMYKEKGDDLVIVSLARAGTPIGILVRKYIKEKYNKDILHYSVSIIRGSGIDKNAINYILENNPQGKIQFVDGWTGKGSITKELKKSLKEYEGKIESDLAVLVDPARLCRIYGTREDFGLATSCLNSTVSGLISRTIYNKRYVKENDFHGAKYLSYLEDMDVSNYFIEKIENEFKNVVVENYVLEEINVDYANKVILKIKEEFNVKDINKIKLSVGESARVLLRRKPRVILVKDINDRNITHIMRLAKENHIEIKEYDCRGYNCISIIEE